MSLSVLQTMKFYIKSGFGQSTLIYGGTKEDPTFGLAQGNGDAPPGFLAVSTLLINAYQKLSHGTFFVGAWTGDVFFWAAVLFVSDSDLLHMVNSLPTTDQAFSDKVQKAIFDWGGLVQVTSGYLKPFKCFCYMMPWRWSKGQPTTKKLRELPCTPLLILQPDGSRAPIPLKDNTVAEKKLGVWTCPSGDFSVHVGKIRQKGLAWADSMVNGHCLPRHAWLGLRHQLYHQMSYGFVALVHPPDLLEQAFQDVWYKSSLSQDEHMPLEGIAHVALAILRPWNAKSEFRPPGQQSPSPPMTLEDGDGHREDFGPVLPGLPGKSVWEAISAPIPTLILKDWPLWAGGNICGRYASSLGSTTGFIQGLTFHSYVRTIRR